MRLDTTGFRFQGLMKTVDGRKFRGIVFSNVILSRVNELADYVLRAGLRCFIRPGDAVIYDGDKYLIGVGTTEYSAFPLFRLFRMITVTDELPWSRAVIVEDVVTGVEREEPEPESLGTALCALVSTNKISDAFKVNTSNYQLITNAPVRVNDRLGPYTVTFTEIRFGLTFAEAR